MKKTALIGIAVIIALIVGFFVLQPIYGSWKDKEIASALESEVLPLVVQNKVTYLVNDPGCQQLNYGTIKAASPKGCAYKENVTDSSKKDLPDFTSADRALFDSIKEMFSKVPAKGIREIRSEEAGLGFHIDCTLCRTRYVYAPNYGNVPTDIEYQIWYTAVNKDWYRVDEDLN